MSNLYFDDQTLRDLDARENVSVSKAHQARSCAACGLPVTDHNAESINIGGGLEVLVHRACMSELTEAMAPKEVRIPVPVTPVRKSTVATSTVPFDVKRMADDAKAEIYTRLLEIGLTQH
jgi:hypothetical protein